MESASLLYPVNRNLSLRQSSPILPCYAFGNKTASNYPKRDPDDDAWTVFPEISQAERHHGKKRGTDDKCRPSDQAVETAATNGV